MNYGKYGAYISWKDQGSVFQEAEKPKAFVADPKYVEGFPSKHKHFIMKVLGKPRLYST